MSMRVDAGVIYRHIRTIDTFTNVAIELEYESEKANNTAKSLVLRNAARLTWELVANSHRSLETMPPLVLARILRQRDSNPCDRYLGGEWLRERSPRVFKRRPNFLAQYLNLTTA